MDDRRAEYPDIKVKPIAFSASELKAAHWKFLMGAIGSQSMYMRQINLIMRGLRDNLTLDALRAGIDNSGLSDHLKELAQTRLLFASEYIDDNQRLQDLIRPGRLIIVDLRDEYIEKDEALGLFVVMLQIFSEAIHQGSTFNKLVVFDEAHKYIDVSAEVILTPGAEVKLTPWAMMAAFGRQDVDPGAIIGDSSTGPSGPRHQGDRARVGRVAQHSQAIPAR
ncbi:hypothetical protein [Achromobacter denitrificans]|uniref:ATP-binding protein n=1 Tax=Achromobacter denitrificans TaxID=32002 RepID=A0ABZ3FWJ6_ACHDE